MAGLKDLFIPKETAFFKYLDQEVDLLSQSVKQISPLIKSYKKQNLDTARKSLEKLIAKGDELHLFIIQSLHETFITPIDRDEIQTLSFNLNRLLNNVRKIVDGMEIYHNGRSDKTLSLQMELLRQEIDSLSGMFRHPLNLKENQKMIHQIKMAENKADVAYRLALIQLFSGKNTLAILKKKELYQILENTIDKAEFVANIMQNVLINHS